MKVEIKIITGKSVWEKQKIAAKLLARCPMKEAKFERCKWKMKVESDRCYKSYCKRCPRKRPKVKANGCEASGYLWPLNQTSLIANNLLPFYFCFVLFTSTLDKKKYAPFTTISKWGVKKRPCKSNFVTIYFYGWKFFNFWRHCF